MHKHHKLTPEQKAARKRRLAKLGKALLWLDPASAAIMGARLISKKIKERRAKRKHSQQAEQVITGFENVVAMQTANSLGQTVDMSTIKASSSPIDSVLASQQQSGADNFDSTVDSASDSDSDTSADDGSVTYLNDSGFLGTLETAFAAAEQKVNSLSPEDKKAVMDELASLKDIIGSNQKNAIKTTANADKKDLSDAKKAVSKNPKGLAVSVTDSELAKDEEDKANKDKEAKKNNYLIYGGIGLGVLVVGYMIYKNSKKTA